MKKNNIRLISSQEIQSVILDCKRKVWNHIEMQPSNQVNEQFVSYMEETIKELSKVLDERKIAA
jgi:hypothetical protein